MKILLEAFIDSNWGDDLFITLFAKHYKQEEIYLMCQDRHKKELADRLMLDNVTAIGYDEAFCSEYDWDMYCLVGGDFYPDHASSYEARIQRARLVKSRGGIVCILGASLYKAYRSFVGIGEFFSTADLVTLRDSKSYLMTQDHMQGVYAVRTADMLFSLPRMEKKNETARRKMGISVRRKIHSVENGTYLPYLEQVTRLCREHLSKQPENSISFLCLSTGEYDDRRVAEDVMKRLDKKERERCCMISHTADVLKYIDMVDQCDFIVATRFHSLALALYLGKPFLPICYEAKLDNLLDELEYDGLRLEYGSGDVLENALSSVNTNRVNEQKFAEYLERGSQFFDCINRKELYWNREKALRARLNEGQDGELRELYTELLRDCRIQEEKSKQVIRMITQIQSAKSYKIGLFLRRAVMQCVRGREQKDFLKWCVWKALGKEKGARRLCEFDGLENVKSELRRSKSSMQAMWIDNEKEVFKKTEQVFIFASVPFFDVGGGQRSAQLARIFNAMGKTVHYIYGFHCSEKDAPDMGIPTSTHCFIDEINLKWFERRLHKGDLVIFEIPYLKFEPYLMCAGEKGAHTVYEHIDSWDTTLGCLFYEEGTFKRFLNNTELITVTARKLGEKIEEVSDRTYLYLPNAVNSLLFEPNKEYDCPKDLVRGKGKTLLYFGSLWGEWFDWERVNYVAKKCPDCEINLIGDYSGCMGRVRGALPNVHFLGVKKQVELPAYLKYTDFALLPFKNCDIGKYVSPLKIFEYIAMNVMVLSNSLDDIQGYPNVICADTNQGWVDAIRQEHTLVDSGIFAAQNSWYARCEAMMEAVGMRRKDYPSVSVIVLNRNNKRVIKRCVETLLTHGEAYSYQVIVVDNASTDGSYEMLEEEYGGRITLVRNEKNGCSSGRNLGVEYATGEYICFLDSDQWVTADTWLDNSLAILEFDETVGAVGWAGGWFSPDDPKGMITDQLEERGMYTPALWYRKDLGYLGSGGMLMKKSLFERIGGFDTYYDPTCFEDTDLSLKIRHAGYELAYSTYSAIMHLPHQTTNSGSAAHTKLMERNGGYF